jgi:hypothetical protein
VERYEKLSSPWDESFLTWGAAGYLPLRPEFTLSRLYIMGNRVATNPQEMAEAHIESTEAWSPPKKKLLTPGPHL